MVNTEFVCRCGKRVGCSPICRECQAEMSAYLASLKQPRLCEMCQRETVYPPMLWCPACVAYIRDCEAEASEER